MSPDIVIHYSDILNFSFFLSFLWGYKVKELKFLNPYYSEVDNEYITDSSTVVLIVYEMC